MHDWKRSGERLVPGHASARVLLDHTSQYQYIVRNLQLSGRRILDVACGVGLGSRTFAEHQPACVIGVDISGEALFYGRRHFAHERVRCCLGDASHLPFPDGMFDIVISLETIEHVPQYEHFLDEVFRVMRSDAILVLSTPNRRVTSPGIVPPNAYHVREFSLAELGALLGPYCSQICWLGQHFIPRLFANRFAHKVVHMLSRILVALGGPDMEAQVYSLGGGFSVRPITRAKKACFEPRSLIAVCHGVGSSHCTRS